MTSQTKPNRTIATKAIPLATTPEPPRFRKSRVCTREACETCREKKARCDGGKPCSRCRARGMACVYETRTYQTKQSLKAQLEELKDAQRQRDAVIEALSAPRRAQKVLQRLWSGDTLESIYGALETRDSSLSPSVDHASNASEILNEETREPLPTCTQQYSMGFPLSFTDSEQTNTDQTHAGRFQCTKDGQEPGQVPYTAQSGDAAPPHDVPNFDELSAHGGPTSFGFTGDCPTVPSMNWFPNGQPSPMDFAMPCLDRVYPSNCFGTGNWWQPSETNSLPWSLPPDSSKDPLPWSNTQATKSFSAPSSSTSPVTVASSLASRPSSRETTRTSTCLDPNSGPTNPPTKKRKSNAEQPVPAQPPVVIDLDAIPDPPETAGAGAYPSPGPEPPRERQRQASARNWQKKKQQTEDLQAAKDDAEARNRELKRQHAEILNEVMAAKNALMGHAKCNHPAISGWLSSQATRYILDRASGDGRKGSSVSAGAPDGSGVQVNQQIQF